MGIDMKTTRSYTQRERAAGAAPTRLAILEATVELATALPLSAVTLPRIAERAGVSVQTVLRRFESRDNLLEAAHAHAFDRVIAELPADPDDLAGALAALVAHYERIGDGMILLLGQEGWEPLAKAVADGGRAFHRSYVETLFAPQLAAADDPRALADHLMIATDLYTWKQWRRDMGRSRDETLRLLTAHVVGGATAAPPLHRETLREGALMTKILIVTAEAGGNVPPHLAIAERLAAAGRPGRVRRHPPPGAVLLAARRRTRGAPRPRGSRPGAHVVLPEGLPALPAPRRVPPYRAGGDR